MSTIAGKNDLPEFSNIRPFIRKEDLAGFEEAVAGFESSLAAFRSAAQKAQSAVQLTLAWVGVGEKLIGLVGVIVQERLAVGDAAPAKRDGRTELQRRLSQLALLQEELRRILPAIKG